jgi:hypothetical protein
MATPDELKDCIFTPPSYIEEEVEEFYQVDEDDDEGDEWLE